MAKSFADWPFLYCAVSAVYQRLAKKLRKEPTDQIFTFLSLSLGGNF